MAALTRKGEALAESLKTPPIYYVSTHGQYKISNADPTLYSIPPNTYVFEVGTAGDWTLNYIDRPLKELISEDRQEFINYFIGNKRLDENFSSEKADMFSSIFFYGPGDTMYNRDLSIGHGIYTESLRHRRPEHERILSGLGFFKSPGPGQELQELLSGIDPIRLGMSGHETITSGSYIDHIKHSELQGGGPAIFIFSSCAIPDHECLDNETSICRRRFGLIAHKQADQRIKLMAMGIHTYQGSSLYEAANHPITAAEAGRRRRLKNAHTASLVDAGAGAGAGAGASGENRNVNFHRSANGTFQSRHTYQSPFWSGYLHEAEERAIEGEGVNAQLRAEEAEEAAAEAKRTCWSRFGRWLCGVRNTRKLKTSGGRRTRKFESKRYKRRLTK